MVNWIQLSTIFVTGYSGKTAIVSIKEENLELSRKTAVINMTAGSFFHDLANQLLYIWPAGSDNPNSNGKTYILYVWIGFCDNKGDFAIQGESNIFYFPVIDIKQVPPYSTSITELFQGDITYQFGEIKISYPEWGFLNFNNYIWINSTITVKYGADNAVYNDYDSILWGLVESVTFSSAGVTFSIRDIRDRLYSGIPPDRFLIESFPYIPDEIHYRARPVLTGKKKGIYPNRISTQEYIYEISQTAFLFGSFNLEEIEAVYKDGVLLTVSTDYTEDLANGRFTLTANPGSSIITCDAKGLKISRNFSTKTWNNTYSSNIADITFFYLKLQNIENGYIDEESFLLLQSNSTGIECGDLVNAEVLFVEKIRELQITGKFHLLPTATGKIEVISYRRSEPPTIQLTDEHYTDIMINQSSQDILNRVLIRYNKNPFFIEEITDGGETLGDWEYFRREKDAIGHKYQLIKMQNFRTIANNVGDAENLANDYISLYERPTETISFSTNHKAISWQLLQKIGITYSEIIRGTPTIIYNQEPFIIISKSINWDGYINLTLRKDPAIISGQPIDDHNYNHVQDHNFNEITT